MTTAMPATEAQVTLENPRELVLGHVALPVFCGGAPSSSSDDESFPNK